MKRVMMALTILTILAIGGGGVNADFSENFDNPTGANGQVLFNASSIYLANGASPSGGDANGNFTTLNGFIIQNNNFQPFISQGFGLISHDQSGLGYFLYEGTNNGSLGPNGSFQGTVWESYTHVPVSTNTMYTFSFYLTNSNGIPNPAIIQPFINGTAVGGGVSAKGYYSDGITGDGWQQFSFTWNSGSSSMADLSLVNQQTVGAGYGDDFGIDTISLVSAVPEPSGIALFGMATIMFAGYYGWRRRKLVAA